MASVRFYAELNEHLLPEKRFVTFHCTLREGCTVQALIESCGVPCAEVDLVLVNGEPEDLQHPLKEEDRVSAFPVFESFDIQGTTKVRIRALRETRFVLDVHLGKLASHLRMLGFDTLYRNDYNDKTLIRISLVYSRILLSKDRALVADTDLTRAHLVRSKDPRDQLVEVLQRFDLFNTTHPFTRCIACNAILEPADKSRIIDLLPPSVAASYEEFRMCPECERVYWKGSHYERMEDFIRGLNRSLDRNG